MRRIISILLVISIMLTTVNNQVFAFENKNIIEPQRELIFKDMEGNKITAKISSTNDQNIVSVYINNLFDHKVTTNTKKDSILLEYSENNKKARLENKQFKISDFVREQESTSILIKEENSLNPKIPFDSNYDDPPSTPAGYNFATSVYSSRHGSRGYLFKKELGEIARYEEKRVTFTKGTAIGVVIGLLASFITGPITIGKLLFSMGTGIIGGVISNYVDSSIWFSDHKNLYKGFCKKLETLTTFQILKYERIYDHENEKLTKVLVGEADGYSGFSGTEQDMAYTAIVNYY